MSAPDPGTVLWISGGLAALLVIVIPWAWLSMEKRVEKAQETAEGKASIEELNRQRDNVTELFKVFREHETADRDRHDQLVKVINGNHVEMMDRISGVNK